MAVVSVRLAAAAFAVGTVLTAAPAIAADTSPSTLSRSDQRAQGAMSRSERASRERATLVRVALTKKGSRYVSGASGPYAFDCSGFVMWVYQRATGRSLPHYSGAQMQRTRRVSLNNLVPGDLLFYGAGGSQHVSMYIGKGRMIHATNPRSGVKIDSIRSAYYRARFAGAGRVIQG